MKNFLGFCRFLALDPDGREVYEAGRSLAEQQRQTQKAAAEAAGQNVDDLQPFDMSKPNKEIPFKGYLPKLWIENELAAWKLIEEATNTALAQYPTTVEEDR